MGERPRCRSVIIDSNVLIDILNPRDDDSVRVAESFMQLALANVMRINPIVFSESCARYVSFDEAESAVADLQIEWAEISPRDAFRAGTAFQAYRKNGGPRITILPDFLIGAQAAVRGWPILTRDPKRFSTYFPEVELIDPSKTGP